MKTFCLLFLFLPSILTPRIFALSPDVKKSSAVESGAETMGGQTIELKQDFMPQVKGEPAELWIPLPMDLKGYQSVLSENFSGNADQAKVETKDSVRMLHVVWLKADEPEFHVVDVLRIQDHLGPEVTTGDMSLFLKPSAHVAIDGAIRETSAKIVGTLTDPDQKAEAIYNWIVENTFRDPNVRGCGVGDAKKTLTVDKLGGKCADINSLFVALARAARIPAREVFGIRVASSKEFPSLGKTGDVSKGQHCRAEYYSAKQKSWIPVDPADIRKAILEEKLTLHDAPINKARQQFFGHWEGNWAALNYGRDFELTATTTHKQIPVNYLMYPMLVSKATSPDGMDPKEVSYVITSTSTDAATASTIKK